MYQRGIRLGSSTALAALLMLALGVTSAGAQESEPAPDAVSESDVSEELEAVTRSLVFPVEGTHHFDDDWQEPSEDSTRVHRGIDISAVRMTPLVAATDGTVTRIRHSNEGAEGNMVIVTDAEGWQYLYIHLNNDTPGTEDDANLREFAFAPDLIEGMPVTAGQLIGFVGDSGNSTGPHLHFGMIDRSGTYVNPYGSLLAADDPTGLLQLTGGGPVLAITGFHEIQMVWIAIVLIAFGAALRTGGWVWVQRQT